MKPRILSSLKTARFFWCGYFYNSDGYITLLEYSHFETSINDFIHKYGRNSDEAFEQLGARFTQFLTKECENNNTREYMNILLDSWVEDASPITAEEITTETPEGFYVLI